MKKVSTAVTMQSRNISQQKLTIGLDLENWDGKLENWGQTGRSLNSSRGRIGKRSVCPQFSVPSFPDVVLVQISIIVKVSVAN